MCDMRGPPRKIKNHQTGEVLDVPYIGNMYGWEEKRTPGIYHTSGSGCGYTYFDGNEWYSGYYSKEHPEWTCFEFLDFGPSFAPSFIITNWADLKYRPVELNTIRGTGT